MNIDDKLEIAKKLQEYHYFFRAFWDIGTPVIVEDNSCPTAAIAFDDKGNALQFIINKNFWESLNPDSRMFVICHEMLHIVLNHGERFVECHNSPDFPKMNKAADVVINELLVSSFGFTRSFLDDRIGIEGCWLDTVFENDPAIKSNESTEYYFNKMPNDPPPTFQLDQHIISQGTGNADDDAEAASEGNQSIKDFIEASGILDKMSPDFLGKIPKSVKDECKESGGLLAGAGAGGSKHSINAKFRKKGKWETVIKKWENFLKTETIDQTERWERVSPRYSHVISDKISLPTNVYVFDEHKEKDKIDVFFFLDTSGSCIGLKDRFYTAARSLNPKKFNIRLFNFDTIVYDVDIKQNNAYGGGGTSFRIIESKIQDVMKKENRPYPKAVWIITDGYGDTVNPQNPSAWYWFLTPHSTEQYIHKTSKIFKLADYE